MSLRKLLLVVLLLFSVLLTVPFVLKGRVYVMQGGSMEPSISNGDLVLLKPAREIREGDVVVYRNICHRVLFVGEETLTTKGDANPDPDPWLVPKNAVVGKVDRVIPRLGSLFLFARSPLGVALFAGLFFLLAFTWTMPEVKVGRPYLTFREGLMALPSVGLAVAWYFSSGLLRLFFFILLCFSVPLFLNSLSSLKRFRERWPFWAIVLAFLGGAWILTSCRVVPGLLYLHHPDLFFTPILAILTMGLAGAMLWLRSDRLTSIIGVVFIVVGIVSFFSMPIGEVFASLFTIVAGAHAIAWQPPSTSRAPSSVEPQREGEMEEKQARVGEEESTLPAVKERREGEIGGLEEVVGRIHSLLRSSLERRGKEPASTESGQAPIHDGENPEVKE
ncbi:MAG: signal peptidase I [Candidatus Hadarchaeales archaeon]